MASTTPNYSAIYSKTYNSFGGVDVHAVFAGNVVLEMQGVSFTISREKAPIYTMGNPNPRAFSRGKRGIAGSLIFTVFDRQALLETLKEQAVFWAKAEEYTATKDRRSDGNTIQPQAGIGSETRLGAVKAAHAWDEDQIPPFTILLVAQSEYGHQSTMQIRGVEILNVGQGISVDDLMIDQQMTFVATDIIPWYAQQYAAPHAAQSISTLATPPSAAPPLVSILGA